MNEFYRRPSTWRGCTSGCEVRKPERPMEQPPVEILPQTPIAPPPIVQEPVPVVPPVAVEPPEVIFPVIPPIVAPVNAPAEPAPNPPLIAQQMVEQQMVAQVATQGSNLNLREQPSTSATVLARIPDGTTITILHRLPGWDYIIYNGMQGYVASEWVKR